MRTATTTVEPAAWSRTGVVVLVCGVAAVSWAAIFVRLAEDAPALTIAAYRLLFATLVLGAVAVWRVAAGRDRVPARNSWPWLALSGMFLAGHFWAWFASLERTSVGSSVVIVAMQPLLATAFGLVFLKESPVRTELWGIGIAAIGLLVIGGRDLATGSGAVAGDGLALLGGLLAAAYLTAGRRLRAETAIATYAATVYGSAAVTLWLLVAVTASSASGFSGETWTYLVLLALVPQAIGHTALNWALARLRVVTVSIAILGEPVGATLLAIPVLGEWPSIGVIVGGVLILGGVVVGLHGSGMVKAAGRSADSRHASGRA